MDSAISVRQRTDQSTKLSVVCPDLEFEEADSIEAGIDFTALVHTRLSPSVFDQSIDSFIQTDLVTERFENAEELSIRGIELLAEQQDWLGVNLRAGYSYLHSRNESHGADEKQQQYTPTHRMTLSADYTWRDAATVHVGAEYTADQFYHSRTIPRVRAEFEDFVVVGVNVSVPLVRNRLIAYAGADNVLDQNYEESYGIPQQGRFVYAGLKLSLP